MFELNAVEATVVATQSLAAGQVQAGIFDTINNLSKDAMVAVKGVATLVVTVIVLWGISRARFAVGAVVMFGLMGGLVLWLVWDGTGFFQNQLGNELENASAAPAVTQYELV